MLRLADKRQVFVSMRKSFRKPYIFVQVETCSMYVSGKTASSALWGSFISILSDIAPFIGFHLVYQWLGTFAGCYVAVLSLIPCGQPLTVFKCSLHCLWGTGQFGLTFSCFYHISCFTRQVRNKFFYCFYTEHKTHSCLKTFFSCRNIRGIHAFSLYFLFS